MSTHYSHHIHPSSPFSHLPAIGTNITPPWAGPVPPSCSPVLYKKKWHFCLFQIATQGVSCGTSVYICIIAQFGSSPLFFLERCYLKKNCGCSC
jgi:hypothetical protein